MRYIAIVIPISLFQADLSNDFFGRNFRGINFLDQVKTSLICMQEQPLKKAFSFQNTYQGWKSSKF